MTSCGTLLRSVHFPPASCFLAASSTSFWFDWITTAHAIVEQGPRAEVAVHFMMRKQVKHNGGFASKHKLVVVSYSVSTRFESRCLFPLAYLYELSYLNVD